MCQEQALANTNTCNAEITNDHLAGMGAQASIRDKLLMPPETFNQVRGLVLKALRRVPDVSKTEPDFFTIRQGPRSLTSPLLIACSLE